MSAQDYLKLNSKYLREAEELLAEGDYPQASEKFWGAATEIVKAVAAKRGIQLGTHRSLVSYVVALHKEEPDLRLQEAFAMAETMHINLYEGNLPEEAVRIRAGAVGSFVETLKKQL